MLGHWSGFLSPRQYLSCPDPPPYTSETGRCLHRRACGVHSTDLHCLGGLFVADFAPDLPAGDGPGILWPPPIPGYRLLAGSKPRIGGFGEIYQVVQESMRRVVCLKILGQRHLHEAEQAFGCSTTAFSGGACDDLVQWQRRFGDEIEITAALRSRYVPAVHEQGVVSVADSDSPDEPWSNDWPYFIMEWIDGPTLIEFLRAANGPWPEENGDPGQRPRRFDRLPAAWQTRLLDLFTEIAHALQDAHQQGIAHLDATPRNILLHGGREVKLIDWGLARRVGQESDGPVKRSERRAGSPDYMASEQVTEDEQNTEQLRPGFPADVYALGGIGYLLLTGQPPRMSTVADREEAARKMRDLALCSEHHAALYQRLSESGAPAFWVDLIKKCLCQSPEGRYQNAGDVVGEIERFRADQDRREREAEKRAVRFRWVAVATASLGLTVFAMTSGLVASLVLWRRAVESEGRALVGETQARASAVAEKASRTEAEARLALIRRLVQGDVLHTNIHLLRDSPRLYVYHERKLKNLVACVEDLLQRTGGDPEWELVLAEMLFQQGLMSFWQDRLEEAQARLERAICLWDQLPGGVRNVGKALETVGRISREQAYAYLEQIYHRQGKAEQARKAFAAVLHHWHELIRRGPDPYDPSREFERANFYCRVFLDSSSPEEETSHRFERIRHYLDQAAEGPESDLYWDLLHVESYFLKAERHYENQEPEKVRDAARAGAVILKRWLVQPALPKNVRSQVAYSSMRFSLLLRWGEAEKEALPLVEQAIRTFQELHEQDPSGYLYLGVLTECWVEVGKVHWLLRHVEERHAEDTLTAFRRALGTLRQLMARAPQGSNHQGQNYREILGMRYTALARKLCELGRLEEAEDCLAERQALWPGDVARHEEVLSDLRKWAAQVGDGKDLSPQDQQERQRYLDLWARLKGKGINAAPAAVVEKP